MPWMSTPAGAKTRSARGPRRRRLAPLAAIMLALLTTGSFVLNLVSPLPKAAGDDAGLKEIGVMAAALSGSPNDPTVAAPMVIDPIHRLGFAYGSESTGTSMLMYDLDTRRLARRAPWATPNEDVRTMAFDFAAKRIFTNTSVNNAFDTNATVCQPASGQKLGSWDYNGTDPQDHKPTLVYSEDQEFPCSGVQGFLTERSTVDPVHRKLYQAGYYASDAYRQATDITIGGHDNEGQRLLIRQLDLDKLESADKATRRASLDWEVDLQTAGCGRIINWLVQRVADDILSYCNDARPATVNFGIGQQGYIVRIPLKPDSTLQTIPAGAPPVPDPTNPLDKMVMNADIRKLPGLPGAVEAFADYSPATGEKILLATSDHINGNAVWVYDPTEKAQRFVGVITGGNADLPVNKSAAGVDPSSGHVYVVTDKGMLVAPTRHDPLPLGTPPYPVVVHDGHETLTLSGRGSIAVLPATRYPRRPTQLFVPVMGKGYVIVEDDIVDPADPTPPDPDLLTSDAKEDPVKTTVTAIGGGVASGVHLLVTGGTKVADNSDPVCTPVNDVVNAKVNSQLPPQVTGTCIADYFLTPGNRETYLGYSQIDAGPTGSNATAAGQVFPSSDQATSADFRNNQFSASGTAGDDGKGFPFPGAQCGDTGDGATQDASPSLQDGAPQNALVNAEVTCNNSLNAATGQAGFGGLTIPDPSNPAQPLFSVARTASSVTTLKGPDGQVTRAEAYASGVTIGPVSIAEVISTATTTAHGRDNKTTKFEFQRQWCGIRVSGEKSQPGCIDPDDPANQPFIDALGAIDRAGGRAWLTVPPVYSNTTQKGYQAEVRKPDSAAEADQVVNNDGSNTVPALQAVFYNDGPKGRSRLVVQLAGVQSASNYGVTALPDFGGGSGDDTTTTTLPTATTLPALPAPIDTTATTEPPAPPAPEPDASTPVLPTPKVSPPVQLVQLGHTQEAAASIPAPRQPGGMLQRVVRLPGEILREALEMLVTKPGQFALLFALWALLAAPAYLAVRRRSLARTLAE